MVTRERLSDYYYYCFYYYFYCYFFFISASLFSDQSRPNDSRMVVALGDAFEKLDRLQEAKKCFFKAHSIGQKTKKQK